MRQVFYLAAYLVASLAGFPLIGLMIFSGWKGITLWVMPVGAILGLVICLGYPMGSLEQQARLIQARSNSFIGRSTLWLSHLLMTYVTQMIAMSIFYSIGYVAHRLL